MIELRTAKQKLQFLRTLVIFYFTLSFLLTYGKHMGGLTSSGSPNIAWSATIIGKLGKRLLPEVTIVVGVLNQHRLS